MYYILFATIFIRKNIINKAAFKLHVPFRFKNGHSATLFSHPQRSHPTPVRLPFFMSGKPKKYFLYDLSFTLYTDANEPLYNWIYIRGRTEMIYGRMGRKDFRPLAFESLLALTCGKKMSDSLHCVFRALCRALFHSLMGSTHTKR